jgi:hypothetical protein
MPNTICEAGLVGNPRCGKTSLDAFAMFMAEFQPTPDDPVLDIGATSDQIELHVLVQNRPISGELSLVRHIINIMNTTWKRERRPC